MSFDFDKAVERVLEVVMFENWLRFYFISANEKEELSMAIPEQSLQKMQQQYRHLVGLAEQLNHKEIDHQASVQAVCLFVATELDGVVIPESMLGSIFDSSDFQIEMQLFGTWVQSHEEQLDAAFIEFSVWRAMFEEWKEKDEVLDFIERLKAKKTNSHTAVNTSVH